MALASVTYTGDGTTLAFSIPFPYIDDSHVEVQVNGAVQSTPIHYSIAGSTVNFVTAPGVGLGVTLTRKSGTSQLAGFQDGNTVTAKALNLAYLQSYYLAQEIMDQIEAAGPAGTAIGTTVTPTGGLSTNVQASLASLEGRQGAGVRLEYVNATTLKLFPRFGGGLPIWEGSRVVFRLVPGGGFEPALSVGGLTANAIYFIYAYWNGTAVALEASTTGAISSGNIVGFPTKSGDFTRTLVGMARVNASTQFQDTDARRYVISWWNRQPKRLYSQLSADTAFTGSGFAPLSSSLNVEFLAFAGQAINVDFNASFHANSTSSEGSFTMAFTNASAAVTNGRGSNIAVNFTTQVTSAATLIVSTDGLVTITPQAAITTGTGTARASYTGVNGVTQG